MVICTRTNLLSKQVLKYELSLVSLGVKTWNAGKVCWGSLPIFATTFFFHTICQIVICLVNGPARWTYNHVRQSVHTRNPRVKP